MTSLKHMAGVFAVGAMVFSATAAHAADSISGAGATFPYPIYAKWRRIIKRRPASV